MKTRVLLPNSCQLYRQNSAAKCSSATSSSWQKGFRMSESGWFSWVQLPRQWKTVLSIFENLILQPENSHRKKPTSTSLLTPSQRLAAFVYEAGSHQLLHAKKRQQRWFWVASTPQDCIFAENEKTSVISHRHYRTKQLISRGNKTDRPMHPFKISNHPPAPTNSKTSDDWQSKQFESKRRFQEGEPQRDVSLDLKSRAHGFHQKHQATKQKLQNYTIDYIQIQIPRHLFFWEKHLTFSLSRRFLCKSFAPRQPKHKYGTLDPKHAARHCRSFSLLATMTSFCIEVRCGRCAAPCIPEDSAVGLGARQWHPALQQQPKVHFAKSAETRNFFGKTLKLQF